MTDLFLGFFNRAIAAGWLVPIVLVLRWGLKKAPKRARLALWGIVAVRLVLPFSLPGWFSLVPSRETLSAEALLSREPVINSGIAAIDDLVNPVFTEYFTPDPAASANPLQIVTAILANVWLLGVAAMALWALIGILRTRARLREAVLLEANVRTCDAVSSPFILGLFRPVIYLPSGMDGAQLPYVLAHERAHLRRGDPLWKVLGFAILAVYWFHPLFWLAYALFCRDLELACDEQVIKALSAGEKKAYSHALVACSLHRRAVIACPLAFGEVGVKTRVQAVLHYKKPARWLALLAVLVCVAAAVCFLTDPKTQEAAVLHSGTYQMENGDGLPAWLTISSDEGGQQFIFSSDPFSSYMPTGTYTLEGDILRCATDDDRGVYCFRIQSDGTLRFLSARSSIAFVRTDGTELRRLPNGSVFRPVLPQSD